MKKLLVVFFALSVIVKQAKAQTNVYHPFPEDSATWCAGFCHYQATAYDQATYRLSGKEVINGNIYSRMLHHEKFCVGAGLCYCSGLNGFVIDTFFIRQDIAQKKVWLYYPPTNADTIFLDFDLHVGDTIDYTKAYWARYLSFGNFALVSSIDSVLIGSQYRTRYNYHYVYSNYPNAMIEGIGPDHGFFYPANQGYDFWPGLSIFSQNNQLFYPYYSPDTSGMWQYCYDFTAGTEEMNETSFISSSPNPSTGNFKLNFGKYVSKGSIEIYSVMGKRVYTEKIYNETEKEVNLKNISGGIYLVKVFDGEKYYVNKISIEMGRYKI